MKKTLLILLLLLCSFPMLNTRTVTGMFSMSNLCNDSYVVETSDTDSICDFDFRIQVQSDGANDSAFIVIRKENADAFVCMLETMREDYSRYCEKVRSGKTYDVYVREFEHSFEKMEFTWLDNGRWYSGSLSEITPLFVEVSEKLMVMRMVCHITSYDDADKVSDICFELCSESEFDGLIFAMNAGNVIEETENKCANEKI